jgi:hypothetical protein
MKVCAAESGAGGDLGASRTLKPFLTRIKRVPTRAQDLYRFYLIDGMWARAVSDALGTLGNGWSFAPARRRVLRFTIRGMKAALRPTETVVIPALLFPR